jgi:phosphatidylglycerophosphate synthase
MATRINVWAWRRGIPNGISLARIGAAPFLLTAALEQNRKCFQWVLVACMLSDILDGWIARTFDWTSRLGASLDSTGDIMIQFIAIGGLWVFYNLDPA